MNIIICGAGEVGTHSAEVLGADGNNITVIDRKPERLEAIEDALDVRTLYGECTHAEALLEAGCANADLLIAATNLDEINLLAAAVASGLGTARTIARVQHSAYFEQRGLDYAQLLGVDHLVCPDYATAVAIAQTVRNPGALAVEHFARGHIEMQQIVVSDNAKVIGTPLAEVRLPGAVRFAAVERDGAAFIPDGRTKIRKGDVVTLIGETTVFEKARKLIHTAADKRKHVVIMGGTPLAVWLCRSLRSRAFSIRLIESDTARAEELSEKLDWVTVLRVNPSDHEALENERLDQVDAFVAVTDDDEDNILNAARAKSMGVRQAVAVLQHATYLHLLKHVGIDVAFSPRVTAVTQIQQLLDDGPIRHLATLAVGIADVYEIRIPTAARKLVDQPLKTVSLPPKTIIAAIQRGDEVKVPGGDDWLAPGDAVVVIAPTENQKQLKSLFAVA